jgi:septal ring factor EnvC (AmiA/AmiB activator)
MNNKMDKSLTGLKQSYEDQIAQLKKENLEVRNKLTAAQTENEALKKTLQQREKDLEEARAIQHENEKALATKSHEIEDLNFKLKQAQKEL